MQQQKDKFTNFLYHNGDSIITCTLILFYSEVVIFKRILIIVQRTITFYICNQNM